MRYPKFALAVAFATTLWAADPFAGTWKMDPAKSQYNGIGPKEQTLVIKEAGSDLDIVVKGTGADGKPISSHFTMPANGGTGKIIESPYESIVGKRVSPTERDTEYSKGGKVVYTTHAKISRSGKALTIHSKGSNMVGQQVDGEVTYSKQ